MVADPTDETEGTVADGHADDGAGDGDDGLPVPLSGSTLVVGPSNVGKTTLTARALERWVDAHGPDGVVVLDFGPEIERDGRLLGGRLSRFTGLLEDPVVEGGRTAAGRTPSGVWYGVLDAHAPRAGSDSEAEAVALSGENARGAAELFARAPTRPAAVFVNDATIAFQHPTGDVDRLLAYCRRADAAVVNAFESDELGTDDAVSRRERRALDTLVDGVDRVCRLQRRP
jgi:hypothetical protein